MKESRAALEASFSASLIPIARNWRRAADKAIPQALGISHALAWPVVVIRNSDSTLRQSELAELLGISHSSMVRLTDQLCANALVERVKNAGDRRANTVKLTQTGVEWSVKLEKEVTKFRAHSLAGISTDELTACLQVFSKIRKNLDFEGIALAKGSI